MVKITFEHWGSGYHLWLTDKSDSSRGTARGMLLSIRDRTKKRGGLALSRDMLPTGPIRRAILNLKALGLAGVFIVLTALAAIPTPIETQVLLAVCLAVFLLLSLAVQQTGAMRSLIVVIIFFCSARYIIWRLTDTLIWYDPVALACGIALLTAEIYGVVILALNLFVNSAPKTRDVISLPIDASRCPTVDVFITTYDEAVELVEATAIAAHRMNYPSDKLTVYLLDDGGTKEKLNDPDPDKARRAKDRATHLKSLADSLGLVYLSRDKNNDAKAGNINAALPRSSGELILFLDADHVPTADFLERTVGYFLNNPKLFLVQTPHFFINPDPLERNLSTFADMPSENEMFYSSIQRGMDSWGAAYFCGSAGLMRRSAVEEVGGFATETVTEDVETSLELHARGGESLYVSDPLIGGLSPESLSAFVIQRRRWAQGMVQLFRLKNPLFKKGLSFSQKICYLSSTLFWFFPLARLVFTLAPVAYYLFAINIFDATQTEFLAYGIPHFFGTVLISVMLFGNVRWLFISEIYELLQAPSCSGAILRALFFPRSGRFRVTPKSQQLSSDFISPIAWPFYLLAVVLVAAEIVGIRQFLEPGSTPELAAIILFWNTFNLVLLIFVIGILFERRQARKWPRMPKRLPMSLTLNGKSLPVLLEDCSMLGARARIIGQSDFSVSPGQRAALTVRSIHYDTQHALNVIVRRKEQLPGEDSVALGLEYVFENQRDKLFAAELLYANSYDWDDFRDSRAYRGQYGQKTVLLFKKGVGRALRHLGALVGAR